MRPSPVVRMAVTLALVTAGLVVSAARPPAKAAPGQPDRWSPVAGMTIARTGHSVTVLEGGKVLVAGGRDDAGRLLSSVEIYDPAQRSWTQGSPLAIPRAGHSAEMMNRFLVVAGGDVGSGEPTATVEVLDPTTGTWAPGPPMSMGRISHTATVVKAVGSTAFRMLVVGGTGRDGEVLTSAEALPSMTFGRRDVSWIPAGNLTEARTGQHAAAVRGDNCVVGGTDYGECNILVIGGTDRHATELLKTHPGRGPGGADPWYEWTPGPLLGTARRSGHTVVKVAGEHCASPAFRLASCGQVLVAGGLDEGGDATTQTEVYDPGDPAGGFRPAGQLDVARTGHRATALPDGRVLVAGGSIARQVEVYDPENDDSPWSVGGDLAIERLEGHTMVALVDARNETIKRVLVAGGTTAGGRVTAAAEVFYAQTVAKRFVAGPSMIMERVGHTATRLAAPDDEKVLVAGGAADAAAEIYMHDASPGSGAWSLTGPMVQAREGHTATLLESGVVVVIGGRSPPGATPPTNSTPSVPIGPPVATAEVYNPMSASWLPAPGQMRYPRTGHTATLLDDGRVLVVGGLGPGGKEADRLRNASPRGVDPSSVPAVKDAENTPAAEGAIAAVEVYDPETGGFTSAAPLPHGRYGHTATLLPDNKVLITGGVHDDEAQRDVQPTVQAIPAAQPIAVRSLVFDPASGTWEPTSNDPAPHADHTATVMGGPRCSSPMPPPYCGDVLVTGGPVGATSVFDWEKREWTNAGITWAFGPETYSGHTALALPSGLVFAVVDRYGYTYDPARSLAAASPRHWELAGEPLDRKVGHTSTFLIDGKVLIAGGRARLATTANRHGPTRAVEIYDTLRPPLDPPSGPGGLPDVVATATTGGVRLRWEGVPADRDGGSPVTGYRVDLISLNPSDGKRLATRRAVTVRDPRATSVELKGLPIDDVLVFEVAAVNEVGIGEWARVVYSNTASGPVPLAPGNVRATPGNSSATVTWDPPPDNGATIAGYRISPYRLDPRTNQPDPRVVPPPPTSVEGEVTSAVVTALSDGHLWAFTVRAVAPGHVEGAESARSAGIIPGLPRGKPRIIAAEPRSRSALVRFVPPSEPGAGPITSYTITAQPGGATVTVGGKSAYAVVPGLANGVEYRFRLRAANQYGAAIEESDLSEASATPVLGSPGILEGVTPAEPSAEAPTVATIYPRGGPVSGGTEALIVGSGFGGTTEVRFGDAPPARFQVVSEHQIVAVVPRFTGPGRVHVTVTGAHGTSTFDTEASPESAFFFGEGGWEAQGFISDRPRTATSATAVHTGEVLATAVEGGATTARLYDPATGRWHETAAPSGVPSLTTRLSNGTVLAFTRGASTCTGVDYPYSVQDLCKDPARAQLYEPAERHWVAVDDTKKTAASGATAELLDGRVLVAGGCCEGGANFYKDRPVTASEIFNPSTRTWAETATGRMLHARNGLTLTTLDGPRCAERGTCGSVLAVGGFRRPLVLGPSFGNPEPLLPPPERYDAASGTWLSVAPMNQNRYGHTATLMADGRVLVTGGSTTRDLNPDHYYASAMAEIYDPAAEAWKVMPSMPGGSRYGHTATLLPSGKVLVNGGIAPNGAVARADIFDPLTDTWVSGGAEQVGGSRLAVTLTSTGMCGVHCGKVMLLGEKGDVELYTPAPVVTAVSPPTAQLGAPTEVTITGRGFANEAQVLVGEAPAEVLEAAPTRLVVRPSTPRHAKAPVSVTTTGGEARSPEPFTYLGPPGAVRHLRAEVRGTRAVRLHFLAAGSVADADPPAQTYVVKQSRAPITEDNFDEARSVCAETGDACSYEVAHAGDALTLDVDGLTPNATYHWAVRAKVGDVLGPMALARATAGATVPGLVEDLVVSAQSTRRALLRFSTTGLDGTTDPPATDYVIRFSRKQITSENFDAARLLCDPVCAFAATSVGQSVELEVSDLAAATTYHFALRPVGHNGRLGPLSRVAIVTTLPLRAGVVTDLLAAAVSPSEVRLTFAAPGSPDDDSPPANHYVIKQSRTPVDDEASFGAARTLCGGVCTFSPAQVGDELALTVTGLAADTSYYYAMRVRHSDGTLGPLSNVARVTTLAPCAAASEAGAGQLRFAGGYHLVSVPSGTALPAPVLYGWFNQGSGRYGVHKPTEAQTGRGYWAWFACPGVVDLARPGARDVTFGLDAYHASIVGNPSTTASAALTGHDFAATWDPAANAGTGAYRMSGYRETQRLDVGQAAWAFTYGTTTLALRAQ